MTDTSEIHVRIMTLRVKKDMLDMVAQRVRESYAALGRQEGFLGASLMSDEGNGVLVSNAMWLTERDLRRSREDEYFEECISRIITLVKGPPEIRDCRLKTIT